MGKTVRATLPVQTFISNSCTKKRFLHKSHDISFTGMIHCRWFSWHLAHRQLYFTCLWNDQKSFRLIGVPRIFLSRILLISAAPITPYSQFCPWPFHAFLLFFLTILFCFFYLDVCPSPYSSAGLFSSPLFSPDCIFLHLYSSFIFPSYSLSFLPPMVLFFIVYS